MHWRAVARILLAALLVTTSGCAGLVETETASAPEATESFQTTTMAQDDPELVNVTGGSFSYDVDLIWERLQSKFAPNVSAPEVAITPIPTGGMYNARYDRVEIDPIAAKSSSKLLLVHEFGHHILAADGNDHNLTRDSIDSAFAMSAYHEGFAEYVAQWYLQRYEPGVQGNNELSVASPEDRWFDAWYTLGYRYVSYRANNTGDASSLRDDPWPTTSEQVLHPERGFEPPKPLSVEPATVNTDGRAEYLPTIYQRRLGEFVLRITLWSHTNLATAKRGATGWGNDRFLRFQSTDGDGFAWVIRYDNATAANRGREAFEEYHEHDRREFQSVSDLAEGSAPDDRIVDPLWRPDANRSFTTELVANETLVVFAGPESFVSNAEALGSVGNVTVRVVNESRENSTVPSTERQNGRVSDLARGGVEPPGASAGSRAGRDGACGVVA